MMYNIPELFEADHSLRAVDHAKIIVDVSLSIHATRTCLSYAASRWRRKDLFFQNNPDEDPFV